MIKLTEAQKTGTTAKDPTGRTIFQSNFLYRDLFLNPEHIISINEEYSSDEKMSLSRIETIRGSFVVVGTPLEIQKQLTTSTRKVLKD